MTLYPLGKLPADHLARLLNAYTSTDPRVILGGRVGEDAAVIDMGDRYLVAKTDPITFAADQIGWYAVNINANDIVCTGARPKWFLSTVLLPGNQTTPDLVDDIFSQITNACEALGITLVGGHTEITYGLDRPILVGQMLGEVEPDRLILTGGALPGDDLILTKRIAIEATAIIAAEKRTELQEFYNKTELDRLVNFLHQPGISIVPEASLAHEVGGVHAMHDPTEGGLATGLLELAEAAQVGLDIFAEALPFDPDCARLCQHYNLDPLGVIASGSLLISLDPVKTDLLLEKFAEHNLEATVIGQVKPAEFGLQLTSKNNRQKPQPLPKFARDEITRLFE